MGTEERQSQPTVARAGKEADFLESSRKETREAGSGNLGGKLLWVMASILVPWASKNNTEGRLKIFSVLTHTDGRRWVPSSWKDSKESFSSKLL